MYKTHRKACSEANHLKAWLLITPISIYFLQEDGGDMGGGGADVDEERQKTETSLGKLSLTSTRCSLLFTLCLEYSTFDAVHHQIKYFKHLVVLKNTI